MSRNHIASPRPMAAHDRVPNVNSSDPCALDLDQVLGRLYPDDPQRGAVVAELETLTYLHQSLAQQATATDRLALLERRIFQLLGVA
ncbi:hypothetical protein [Trichothermofontia sp.]